MVSRSNLSGRAPMGGVLGRAYKGPSGRGKVVPSGMEEKMTGVGQKIRAAQDSAAQPAQRNKGIFAKAKTAVEQRRAQLESERAAKYPTTSPGVGETAYRPGFTDKDAARIKKDERRRMSKPERKAAKRQDVFARMQKKMGGKKRGGLSGMVQTMMERQREANAPPPVDTTQIGIRESLGDAYVEPGTRPPLGGPGDAGAGMGGPGSPGGNATTGAPRRRGSAASRSRRINR